MNLKSGLLLAFASLSAAAKCDSKLYPGYACCNQLLLNADLSDLSNSTCAGAQKCLFENEKWCPNPDFQVPDDLSVEAMEPWPAGAPDGHVNLLVYRASTLGAGNPYATKLENANAADRAGVLSYLHSEVVGEDMRYRDDITNNRRKFSINAVVVFNVTIYNPKPWQTPKIPLSPYVAFDKGKCLTTDPGCEAYTTKGYQVGYQTQSGNKRTNYAPQGTPGDYWYSFPEKGLCDSPNATKTCTYSYDVVGYIDLDEMVGLPGLGYQTYFNFSADKTNQWKGIEYSRKGRDPPLCCQETGGLDFWQGVCDYNMNKHRIQKMMETPVRPMSDWGKFYNTSRDCAGDEATGKCGTSGGGEGGAGKKKLTTGEIIAIAAGGCVAVGVGFFVAMWLCKNKRAEREPLLPGNTAAAPTYQQEQQQQQQQQQY